MRNQKKEAAFPADFKFHEHQKGLTKREYFAAMIAQGLSANTVIGQNQSVRDIAKASIEMADELLKQLEQ